MATEEENLKVLQKQLQETKNKENELDDSKDSTETTNDTSCGADHSQYDNEDELQQKLEYFIYKRKSDVKFNRDVNLLIISDEYQKDVDIQAIPDGLEEPWLSA